MTIKSICEKINNLIDTARKPMATIPAAILVCSAINRPGLSPTLIAANIIRRQSEAGAPFGPAADGGANIAEAMERIRVEELVKAIKMDAKVQIGIPIGGILFQGTGGNAAGDVIVNGCNINAPHGVGIVG